MAARAKGNGGPKPPARKKPVTVVAKDGSTTYYKRASGATGSTTRRQTSATVSAAVAAGKKKGPSKPKGEDALWGPTTLSKPKPKLRPGVSGKGSANVIDLSITPLESALRKNARRAANAVQGKPGSAARTKARKQTQRGR